MSIILPFFVAVAILYRLDPFEPVLYIPLNELSRSTLTAPLHNNLVRLGFEDIAKGQAVGPEDLLRNHSSVARWYEFVK
jgi:hypothetical protein